MAIYVNHDHEVEPWGWIRQLILVAGGPSGNALLLRSDQLSIGLNNANLDILYGIASFGEPPCENPALLDVCTRVSSFSDWIAEVMDGA